ncbi:hypothetical protein H0H93_011745 [Arthromyces matolae]|nr:hypothetical protein H0H93_011745 [Arthromyces matolae]
MYSGSHRRPWSPEPFDSGQPLASTSQTRLDDLVGERREASDPSVEALDLADYARTLRTQPIEPIDHIMHTPSLVSRDGTRSSTTHPTSTHSHRHYSFPLNPRILENSPYTYEPRIRSQDSEINIAHFSPRSQQWYNSIPQPTSPPDIYTPIPKSHFHLNPQSKPSPFDPGQIYPEWEEYPPDPAYARHTSSLAHESTGNLLPWGIDPLDSLPMRSALKEERIRMLEREFGPQNQRPEETDDGQLLDRVTGKPLIGTAGSNGYLITRGPKKRLTFRIAEVLLTLTAGVPSIYAALFIKSDKTPPPAGKAPAFVLYFLSIITFVLLMYLFVIRPCCLGKRSKGGVKSPFTNGMMVLPIQHLPGGKKAKDKKNGKKGQPANGDVQVNVIVDPEAFGNHRDSDDDNDGTVPGDYKTRSHKARRRSVFAGLAMEERWKEARAWARKVAIADAVLIFAWGAMFVFIMIGQRCPIGGFNGWCNAYNVSSAAACLLAFAFGVSTYFNVIDLNDSKDADIEALILSGEFFNGPQRSSSPTRSPSPDAGWHDHELNEEAKRREQLGLDYDSDEERRDLQKARDEYGESIGMGPGRTGVKGVIRDRDESERLEREKKSRELEETRTRMERTNLGGKTFLEEEREKGIDEKVDAIVLKERESAVEQKTDLFGRVREGRFGHLREVGAKGFLKGIESEQRGVWVVVHLYDPSLERCYLVDNTLAQLARQHPDTKFLRARAAALGFARKSKSSKTSSSHVSRSRYQSEDDDDPYAEGKDEEEDEEDIDDDDVDLDVLPTMLVYRDGDLVYNWVRVDWEAGESGIKELLDNHHILPRPQSMLEAGSNLGLPSDDDFDLLWSDDDDVDHDT